MRFLHLADLHIGKRVNGFSLIEDQKFVFEQVYNVIENEKIDGIIMAGDIYDKPVPSAEAVKLFDEMLTRLVSINLPIFVISGNHDSAERIGFGSDILSAAKVYMSRVYNGNLQKIELEDDVTFSFRSIGEIREGDVYTGYRVSLSANYPPMAVPLKLDITTGDKITPKEIEYQFKLLLEDRSISVLAYNLETIMAEKLETVISRGDQNTRPRDYYDIYILAKLQYANIEPDALGAALNATTEKRGSSTVVKEYRSIMDTVKSSEVMQKQWKNYQKDFEYATDIALEMRVTWW